MKNENQTLPVFPSGLKTYFLAARPKTWPLSLAPVFIGASMVPGELDGLVLFLTFMFSLSIQIGTNYANDYFDFIKGADNQDRVGPPRAAASGWISPKEMGKATGFVFLLALTIAIPLMFRAGIWSFPLAISCVLFGIFYTGGPKPIGYVGAAEILVLLFFGPVACCGTYFLQTGGLEKSVLIASLAPGFFSTAALVANNLRDEATDKKAGKKTLIVRFGRKFGSWEYTLCILSGSLTPFFSFIYFDRPFLSLAPLGVLLLAIPSIRKAFTFQHPRELISVLQTSALLLVVYTFLFCIT